MLTVDFDRLEVGEGSCVLDLGCGNGRHAFEAWRRGATVVALDASAADLVAARAVVGAMTEAAQLPGPTPGGLVNADALALPFADAAFDRVIAAEVLEHIPDDHRAIRELARVLRPGGRLAVTVPSHWPERVCWALDRAYHDRPGGHVRIYRRRHLERALAAAGCVPRGAHRAHALHSPYWWLRCATGVDRVEAPAFVRRYHDLLVWQIEHRPAWLEAIEHGLDPVLGKSLVVYADRTADRAADRAT